MLHNDIILDIKKGCENTLQLLESQLFIEGFITKPYEVSIIYVKTYPSASKIYKIATLVMFLLYICFSILHYILDDEIFLFKYIFMLFCITFSCISFITYCIFPSSAIVTTKNYIRNQNHIEYNEKEINSEFKEWYDNMVKEFIQHKSKSIAYENVHELITETQYNISDAMEYIKLNKYDYNDYSD
jgi:hypothetical protein